MNELEQRLGAAGGPRADAGWHRVRAQTLAGADARGLIDLAYERHDSPFGTLLVVAGNAGIVRIALSVEDEAEVLTGLSQRISPRIGRIGRESITMVRNQLDGYFGGRRREFEVPLDWRLTRGFRREVLRHTALVPYGSTASYREMAVRAGSPNAVRAAGSALATNPLPILVPCHRILRSDGKVGSYLGGSSMKESLLTMERERD